jgi:hypothetical protein
MTTFPTAVNGVIADASEYNVLAAAVSAVLTSGGKLDVNQFSGPVSPQEFNVRTAAYGALGNDAHDDAPAILAARADAVAAGQGVIYVPPGIYRVRTPLTGGNKITYRGAGMGQTIIRADTSMGGCFYDGGAWTDFHVEGITFDANGQTSTSAFQLYNGGHTRLRVTGCQFIGSSGVWAVRVGSSATISTDCVFAANEIGPCSTSTLESCLFVWWQDSEIVRNIFRDRTGSFAAALGLYAYHRNVGVIDNTFYNNQAGDCYIQQSDTILYRGNRHRATSIGEIGLQIINCQDIKADGNIFAGFASGGFANNAIQGYDYRGTTFDGETALYQNSKGISIERNKFRGVYAGVQIPALALQAGHNTAQSMLRIVDNTFSGCLSYAINVGGAIVQNIAEVDIWDNKVEDRADTTDAIFIQGNPGFTSITTTQGITANAAAQVVTVSGTPAGLVAGQTVSIDTAGNQETVQVSAVAAGVSITAIFTKNHSSGVTISLDSSVVGVGISGVQLARNRIARSSASPSTGIHIDVATDVKLYGNDVTNTGRSHPNVYLTGGGAYAEARNNPGLNPVGLLGPPTIGGSPWTFTNTYGVDAQFAFRGGTTSVIAVDGVTLATTTPAFVTVPNGSTVSVTYAAAPTVAVYGL